MTSVAWRARPTALAASSDCAPLILSRDLTRQSPGAWGERKPTRIGEAKAGVAGRSFGERCGQHRGVRVVVVVDLGSGLAWICTQDPAGVLDKAAFEGQRSGEEQGVQDGAVEAFADVRAGRDDQEGLPAGSGSSRASAAARALAPMPPRSTTGSWPKSPSALARRSR